MGELSRATVEENEQLLVELLQRALAGDDLRTRRVLQAALSDSGRDHVPDNRPELVVFARAHIIPRVIVLSGVRGAASLLEELERLIEPRRATPTETPLPTPSKEPSSDVRVQRLSVILIDRDSLSRTGLARALVQAACDVSAGPVTAEVLGSIGTWADVDALVFDPESDDVPLLAAALFGKTPPPLIAWTRLHGEAATTAARVHGLGLASVVSKSLPPRQVTFAIRAIAIANRRANAQRKSR
jgi:hypothetical protein